MITSYYLFHSNIDGVDYYSSLIPDIDKALISKGIFIRQNTLNGLLRNMLKAFECESKHIEDAHQSEVVYRRPSIFTNINKVVDDYFDFNSTQDDGLSIYVFEEHEEDIVRKTAYNNICLQIKSKILERKLEF